MSIIAHEDGGVPDFLAQSMIQAMVAASGRISGTE
jgi:hypothetical protein